MRTLSLKKDTSQGEGGPPASSHSASSVVDASNVVSNTMMPPSPTCGPSKKRGVSSRNRNVMRGIRRGDFRVSSTEFRGNALPRVSHLRSLFRRATKNHLRLRVSTFLKKFPRISTRSPFRNRPYRVCYGQSGFRDRLYARWRVRRAHVLAWLQFACAMQTSRVRSLNKQRQVSRRIRKTV